MQQTVHSIIEQKLVKKTGASVFLSRLADRISTVKPEQRRLNLLIRKIFKWLAVAPELLQEAENLSVIYYSNGR